MTRSPTRPTVAVFDPLPASVWSYDPERQILDAVDVGLRLIAEPAPETLGDVDVLLVHERPVGAAELAALQRCIGIVTYSVGTNQVDQTAADAAGIPVRNCPTFCTDEVADHALALTLALARRLVPMDAAARAGQWDQFQLVSGLRRVRGQTMGILGAGRIGRRVAERAQVFGYRTIACDPFVAAPDPMLPLVELPELLQRSDVLVVCASQSPGAPSIVDRTALGWLRPGATVVNVARGRAIDEAALADALQDGRVVAAALDVRVNEPPVPGPLDAAPNVLMTPHVAGLSVASLEDLHYEAATTAVDLLRRAGRVG